MQVSDKEEECEFNLCRVLAQMVDRHQKQLRGIRYGGRGTGWNRGAGWGGVG